jgi:pyruvate dehydrogenase E1 component beta subunit
MTISYADGIRTGFEYLLSNHPEVFVFGQGLWSPWYVGSSMKDLDKNYGRDRIIDSPVSEFGVTSSALGAALCGFRPVVVHPRIDFMIFAMDSLVNQAAKWQHMFGGQTTAPLTVRAIINRGGEQGAQHSQALHSWFAHIPGLRVVMPASAADARDLLIASVLSDDPVLYIDDRWCYDLTDEVEEPKAVHLDSQGPNVVKKGTDITLVGAGHSVRLLNEVADELSTDGISCEVVDLRIINPLRYETIVKSVKKTKRLLVVDGGWKTCGLGGEIIAGTVEKLPLNLLQSRPARITLTDAPAPTAAPLEQVYYTTKSEIVEAIQLQLTPQNA